MWSIAGVVTRHLDSGAQLRGDLLAQRCSTRWRCCCCSAGMRGPGALWRTLRSGGRRAVGVGPVLVRDVHRLHGRDHADHRGQRAGHDGDRRRCSPRWLARVVLGHRLAARTWGAIVVAGAGIAWMYGSELSGCRRRATGSAPRWRCACRWPRPSTGRCCSMCSTRPATSAPDMLAPVLLGALLSAAVDAAAGAAAGGHAARPGAAGAAGRGAAGHSLPAGGAAGPRAAARPRSRCWACWRWSSACSGPGWAPTRRRPLAVLGGGALVLGALAANEALALRRVARAT